MTHMVHAVRIYGISRFYHDAVFRRNDTVFVRLTDSFSNSFGDSNPRLINLFIAHCGHHISNPLNSKDLLIF